MPLFVLAGVGGQEVLLMLAGQKDRCSKTRNKQDNARHMTSQRAHPFREAHFEIIQFVCAVNQFIITYQFIGSGFIFVDRFTFSFAFSFTFGFLFSLAVFI
jgi:hypothetical protein